MLDTLEVAFSSVNLMFFEPHWSNPQLITGMLAPAQYWHDPLDHPGYVAGGEHPFYPYLTQFNTAKFLPLINNERAVKSSTLRKGLARLKLFVMVMWRNDTTVKPKESSHFQFFYPNQVA